MIGADLRWRRLPPLVAGALVRSLARPTQRRPRRLPPPYDGWVLRAVVYWTAVVVISLAFVVLLVLFFESRDQSSLDGGVIIPLSAPPLS